MSGYILGAVLGLGGMVTMYFVSTALNINDIEDHITETCSVTTEENN